MLASRLDRLLAAILDALPIEEIVAKCGGEGSNRPGPCPENKPEGTTPGKPSHMPGADARTGRPGKPSSQHQQRLKLANAKLQDSISQAVAAGLPQQAAADYHAAASDLLHGLPPRALLLYHQRVKEYHWFKDVIDLRQEYGLQHPGDPYPPAAWYDPDTGHMYLDGEAGQMEGHPPYTIREIYAHETGHVLDGKHHEISRLRKWQDALNADTAGLQQLGYDVRRFWPPDEGLGCVVADLYGGAASASTISNAYPECLKVLRNLSL